MIYNKEADRKYGEAIYGEIEKRKDEIEPLQEEWHRLTGTYRGFSIYEDGSVDNMVKNLKKELKEYKEKHNIKD